MDEARYVNRELSWLEFNSRVLDEGLDESNPMLERLKFLSIFTTNLDEFFMVRVAGLLKVEQEGLQVDGLPDGLEVREVLDQVSQRTRELLAAQYRCLSECVLPALEERDVKIIGVDELTPAQRVELDDRFLNEIHPVLTPLAFDPAHPFPFLTNLHLYLVVVPKELDRGIGFVNVPSVLPRIIRVNTKTKGQVRYVLLEDVIAAHLPSLFFGFEVAGAHTIRVTRNLDYDLLENEIVDLLKTMQKEVISREHQEPVRLEVDDGLPEPVLAILQKRLKIDPQRTYRLPKPLFIPGIMDLYRLSIPGWRDEPFNPRLPPSVAATEDFFALIAKGDLLVHHPYESFYAVTEFLTAAAQDPDVLAIKQTLYRTAGDSPIIDALIEAAQNGKQVTAVVELKARFDEKNNITWARRLERAGVNVVFGFIGLKTHGKATLVVRKEKNKIVRYVHLATGNYNSSTARLYTDLGLFTTDESIGQDISSIFNLVTGFDVLSPDSRSEADLSIPKLNCLAIAPLNLRSEILRHISHEIDCVNKHGSGMIVAKMNALVDKQIIEALYQASQAGVKIRLIVRGICCLRPGVAGLSDNIKVISIIDRFLEHSRIFYFQAAGEQNVFISSADWMPRNMDRRIEFLTPIRDPAIRRRLIDEILELTWRDNVKARTIDANGGYRMRTNEKKPLRSQHRFIELARQGGVKSIPYDAAIRHKKKGVRPIAKKIKKRKNRD